MFCSRPVGLWPPCSESSSPCRLSSGSSGAAQGLEFSVIAAVVVGGPSLSSGRGSMLGTLLGVLSITVIGNGAAWLGIRQMASAAGTSGTG